MGTGAEDMSTAQKHEEEVLANLVMRCAFACASGQKTVTISTRGKHPPGFPRGELLSEGTNGEKNYAICPVKVLTWIHKKAMANAELCGGTSATNAVLNSHTPEKEDEQKQDARRRPHHDPAH